MPPTLAGGRLRETGALSRRCDLHRQICPVQLADEQQGAECRCRGKSKCWGRVIPDVCCDHARRCWIFSGRVQRSVLPWHNDIAARSRGKSLTCSTSNGQGSKPRGTGPCVPSLTKWRLPPARKRGSSAGDDRSRLPMSRGCPFRESCRSGEEPAASSEDRGPSSLASSPPPGSRNPRGHRRRSERRVLTRRPRSPPLPPRSACRDRQARL